MLPKLTGKPAASTHFSTAKGEVVYLATKTWDCIYKTQVSILESNAFKEDINMVNNQLHSNYRNSCCNFITESVSEILGCINNNIIRKRRVTFCPVLGTFIRASGIKLPVRAYRIQARHWYAGAGLEDHENDKGLKHLEVKASSSLSTHSLQFTKEKENWKATNCS